MQPPWSDLNLQALAIGNPLCLLELITPREWVELANLSQAHSPTQRKTVTAVETSGSISPTSCTKTQVVKSQLRASNWPQSVAWGIISYLRTLSSRMVVHQLESQLLQLRAHKDQNRASWAWCRRSLSLVVWTTRQNSRMPSHFQTHEASRCLKKDPRTLKDPTTMAATICKQFTVNNRPSMGQTQTVLQQNRLLESESQASDNSSSQAQIRQSRLWSSSGKEVDSKLRRRTTIRTERVPNATRSNNNKGWRKANHNTPATRKVKVMWCDVWVD